VRLVILQEKLGVHHLAIGKGQGHIVQCHTVIVKHCVSLCLGYTIM
jgi:hypothetical protein